MMRRILFTLSITSIACSGKQQVSSVDDAATTIPITGKVTAQQPASVDLASANRQFALDAYRVIADQPGNLAFSPASVSTAMAMTYAGTVGQSGLEISKALHFPIIADGETSPVHEHFKRLLQSFSEISEADGTTLAVANRLWGQTGSKSTDAFISRTSDSYSAPAEFLDYGADPDGSRKTINTWVADQTSQIIKELLPDGSITPSTEMVLTNAIYFKGSWANKFDKRATSSLPFQLTKTQSVDVPMMHSNGDYRIAKVDGNQMLELPYVGDRLSMFIVLPKDDLSALEKDLSPVILDRLKSELRSDTVELTLPRFEARSEIEFKEVFQKLGVGSPFAFSDDFAPINSGQGRLKIDQIYHQTFVKVDEEGSEAAGATAVVIVRESAGYSAQFRADKPFLYFIEDKTSNQILFMGRVINPKS